jgi:hypothetical protein
MEITANTRTRATHAATGTPEPATAEYPGDYNRRHPPGRRPTMPTHRATTRRVIVGVAALFSLSLLLGAALVKTPAASAAANGPYNFPNSAIADQAETHANGTAGDQCLVFVANMVKAAGGPTLAFGFDTTTYQAQWAQNASPVGSLADAQRGDIVQWGGGSGVAGGTPHTAIITTAGRQQCQLPRDGRSGVSQFSQRISRLQDLASRRQRSRTHFHQDE